MCGSFFLSSSSQVEWTYRWAEVKTFEVTDHAVVVLIKDMKKKLFGMVDNKKVILLDHEVKRSRLDDMLHQMLTKYNENAPTI